ncbi:MAG: rod shape-determining protein MreD [Gammaproteobacteria bacterium]|nr:rod shape-determining protein MreD [Gammaproteobacteria bacterium]
MSRDQQLHRLPMIVSAVIALVLSVLPLPHWGEVGRPDFLVIVVLYWAIMSPRAGGLLLAFIAGLALDAAKGVVLGQHALALTLATAIAINLHLRIRVFPILHQALTIFMLLVIYQFVLYWIDGASGHPVTTMWRWLPAFTGAALWPVFAGLLGIAYQRT